MTPWHIGDTHPRAQTNTNTIDPAAIDPAVRRSLSNDMRRLVTGRMTNDEFDDVYFERYEASGDRGVREIAGFCYSLYSSDVLFPYRLRGIHAVDEERRTVAIRAVLFLRSELQYEWPEFPDNPGVRLLGGAAMFFGIPSGIAVMVCGLVDRSFVVLGLLLLICSIAVVRWSPARLSNEWKSFQELGDYDVWPFFRRADFARASQSGYLLGRTLKKYQDGDVGCDTSPA